MRSHHLERRAWLGALVPLAGTLALSVAGCGSTTDRGEPLGQNSQASVKTPNGGDVPYYARIERSWIYHDDEWAGVAFYRPPSCVPAGFNLLDLLDIPGAFACTPITTDGFSIWDNGPGTDPAPTHVQLDGLGAVPIWFVKWSEMQDAVADGVLTIGELGALPSLLVGTASTYHENLHPLGTANVGMIEISSSGTLQDCRSFRFNVKQLDGVGMGMVVHIDFK